MRKDECIGSAGLLVDRRMVWSICAPVAHATQDLQTDGHDGLDRHSAELDTLTGNSSWYLRSRVHVLGHLLHVEYVLLQIAGSTQDMLVGVKDCPLQD